MNFDREQRRLLEKRKQISSTFKHWGISGFIYEGFLRKFLRSILRKRGIKRYKVGFGEILFPDSTHSGQLDIIIYNPAFAVHEEDEAVLVRVEGVRCVFEVKSIFSLRASWKSKLQAIANTMAQIKDFNEDIKTFYFSFKSDKYTLDEHRGEIASSLSDYNLDDFFVLRTRGPKKRASHVDVAGELERLVERVVSTLI